MGDLVQGKYNRSIYSQEPRGKRQEEMWEIIENTHEPIIDRNVFLQIQQMKRKNRKTWKDRQGGIAYENIFGRDFGMWNMQTSIAAFEGHKERKGKLLFLLCIFL